MPVYSCDSNLLLLTELDDGDYCYQKTTAETHYLAAFPSLIVSLLLASPLSTTELSESIAKACEIDIDDNWNKSLQKSLYQLLKYQIVQCSH